MAKVNNKKKELTSMDKITKGLKGPNSLIKNRGKNKDVTNLKEFQAIMKDHVPQETPIYALDAELNSVVEELNTRISCVDATSANGYKDLYNKFSGLQEKINVLEKSHDRLVYGVLAITIGLTCFCISNLLVSL